MKLEKSSVKVENSSFSTLLDYHRTLLQMHGFRPAGMQKKVVFSVEVHRE